MKFHIIFTRSAVLFSDNGRYVTLSYGACHIQKITIFPNLRNPNHLEVYTTRNRIDGSEHLTIKSIDGENVQVEKHCI